MKLILSTALAALVSTAAIAGNSDRYTDQRLDTSIQEVTQSSQSAEKARVQQTRVVFSSRDSGGKGYPYSNPYGVGPNNDSR